MAEPAVPSPSFVLDASVVITWSLGETKRGDQARTILRPLELGDALVPSIWPAEVANAFMSNERRGRVEPGHVQSLLVSLAQLPIRVSPQDSRYVFGSIVELARYHTLSVYDASYLALALERRLPLATFDHVLERAATDVGVELLAGSLVLES